jgi:hypothetical protein
MYNTSAGDRKHLIMLLPERFAATSYLRWFLPLENRPHRTLSQLPPAQAHTRPPRIDLAEHQVRRKQVLGGLTHEYQIAA